VSMVCGDSRWTFVVCVFVDPKACAVGARGRWAIGHIVSLRAGQGDGIFVFDGEHGHEARDFQNPHDRLRWIPQDNGSTCRACPGKGHDEHGQARRIYELQAGQIKDDLRLTLFRCGGEGLAELGCGGEIELAVHGDQNTTIGPAHVDAEW